MPIPTEVVDSIKSHRCILFLGAMASASSPEGSRFDYKEGPPSGAHLSKILAGKCDYPDEDRNNLPRVSLHYEVRPNGSRQALIQAINESVGPFVVPSPALRMLAELPFPIVITTNYDHLFDVALGRANTMAGHPKIPIKRVYDPNREGAPESVPLDPSEEHPIYLKLHGDLDNPESIVVTEEDYLVFIQKMGDPHQHPIHENIRARINNWPVLFVGYSLKDYNLRLLFRTLRWHVDAANIPLSYSVDPSPDNLIVSVWQHGEKPMVSFVQQDLWDFVPELYQQCLGVEFQA